MKKNIFPFAVLITIIALTFNLHGVEINKIPNIQIAGLISVNAISTNPDSIKWQIDQITIDETSGDYKYTANTQAGIGDTAKFVFIKYPGKYSFYKIFADDGISKDSMEIQVFNKEVPQKYLFSNPNEPNKPIVVYIVLPSTLSNKSNFVMVMHGTNRNADDYADSWKDFVKNNDYIVAAPKFSDADWSHSRSYNLGNMFTGTDGDGNLNPEYKWAFSVVKNVHNELFTKLALNEVQYDIWGHSAGSQFVHRMMEFLPDENIRFYIAANAGWYTMPNVDIDYPYGFKHDLLTFTSSDFERMNKENMIVMRGTADTIRDSNLRTTPEADAQGINRYERALSFYNIGFDISDAEKWQLIDVPDVGHDHELMAIAAQNFLLDNPITSVNIRGASIPSDFILYQNYPNPFNPTTIIKYSIPSVVDAKFAPTTNVALQVYDILGREVALLVNAQQTAGNYEVEFNASQLSSGIYYYRITYGGYALTKKLVLLK